MWAIIELIALIAIVILFITEYFWPLMTGKPLFGSFRKTKPAENKKADDGSLGEKVYKTKEKVEEVKEVVKEVQQEATENFKTAEQLKEESDNLLK